MGIFIYLSACSVFALLILLTEIVQVRNGRDFEKEILLPLIIAYVPIFNILMFIGFFIYFVVECSWDKWLTKVIRGEK